MANKSKLKLFGKIHLFDVIVILLLLVMLMGLANRLSGNKLISSLTGASEKKIEVVLRTREYPVESLKSIKIGEQLSENKQYLDGEVTAFEILERKVSYVDENGVTVVGDDPFYKCADVTFVAKARYNEPVYTIGKQEYVAGSNVFLTTGSLNLKAIVISVKEID